MSKSRDRRRRWQRREARGMNHPFTRAIYKVGRAAGRAGRTMTQFGDVFKTIEFEKEPLHEHAGKQR